MGWEGEQRGCLADLREVGVLPRDQVFLGVCDGIVALACACQLDVLLHSELELECALTNNKYKYVSSVLLGRTLSFRNALLFSLHHARASVQLYFDRASSMRCMSVNKSISTRVYGRG